MSRLVSDAASKGRKQNIYSILLLAVIFKALPPIAAKFKFYQLKETAQTSEYVQHSKFMLGL